MSGVGTLPFVDECASVYDLVFREFRDERFTREELEVLLAEAEDGVRWRDGGDLRSILSLLVAYGLFERDGSDGFRVRCRPDESAAEWHAALEPHVETLHRRIQDSDWSGRPSLAHREAPRTVTHSDGVYLAVEPGDDTGFRDLVAELTEALERDPGLQGIVLTSSATEVGDVQGIADRLHDGEEMAETACPYRFEKEDSAVVGEDKDHLEYRLFLTPEST